MKKNILFLTVILFLLHSKSYGQLETSIKQGTVNLAILKVDLETYEFKGGNLSYYNCPECENDTLPFTTDYISPVDLGSVTFKLTSTADTIFDASIFWMGTGEIFKPITYSLGSPFAFADTSINKPGNIKYYHINDGLYDDYFDKGTDYLTRADSVWKKVSSLEITKIFLENNAKVGIYLYPASVGMFYPAAARWIVFLYFADKTNAVHALQSNSFGITIYPNPSANLLTIDLSRSELKRIHYSFNSIDGKVMMNGEINSTIQPIDLSNLLSGFYLLNIYDDNGVIIASKKIIKE